MTLSSRRASSAGRPVHEVPAAVALALVGLVVGGGCGAPERPPVPFRPEPVPYADTLPVEQPEPRGDEEVAELIHATIRDAAEPFGLRGEQEALNIDRYDDVVNSAWFEHRNDRRPLTPEEVARGPTTGNGPDTSRTLNVVEGKSGGYTPGFTVEDARGDRYLFKFDAAEYLHLGSAAGVISNRLFWAAGWHVPEDYIVVFDPARLEIGEDAEVETAAGTRPLTREHIQEVLDHTRPLPDGRYIALASKFLEGEPLGPFMFHGIWDDDPNDYYHHEYRRDLRGMSVVSAWLNHFDMRFANTLDMYVEPGYVKHHLIDFGSTLGSSAGRFSYTPRTGREHRAELWTILARMVTLGVYTKGWEFESFEVEHPSIGFIPTDTYDPEGWRPGWPNKAFNFRTDRDGYWGAKLVASFSDEQIRAAVGEGHLPPEAAATLERILIFRRDRTVKYWFGRVTPVENFRVAEAGGRTATDNEPRADEAAGEGEAPAFTLEFEDLGIKSNAFAASGTRYVWNFSHAALGRFGQGVAPASEGARQRLVIGWTPKEGAGRRVAERGEEHDRVVVLTLRAAREGAENRAAKVYFVWDGERYRVAALEH
jgi:hypothetical protein